MEYFDKIIEFFSTPIGIMIITITITAMVTALISYVMTKAAFRRYKKNKNVFVESCTEIAYRYHLIVIMEDNVKYTLLMHPGGILKIGEKETK